MPLSWNEIRQRSITFARDWAQAAHERAESQTFWNEFFHVFGISRRAVTSFEEPVKTLKSNTNFFYEHHRFVHLFMMYEKLLTPLILQKKKSV